MSNSRDSGGSPVQSVDRAVTVLEILARDGEAGVSDLATELGVHKSTAFRLVAALENRGLVRQNADRGKYRLGEGIRRLAASTTRRELVQLSRPVCERLAKEVGETVNITVLSGREALYLDQAAGPSALQLHNWVGRRMPVHATSNGKVLLAYLPPARLGEHLVPPLAALTEHTIVDPARFAEELARVRERGYATAVDELEIGLTALAAPIHDITGEVAATVSASGPSFRLTPDRMPAVAEAVLRAAAEISFLMGHQ
jgi:DNA-binding IclR family transcriptional regulator